MDINMPKGFQEEVKENQRIDVRYKHRNPEKHK